MNVARTIAKNTMFNFIATALDSAAIFATGIVLARSLGSEQYGLYSLMMWFIYLAILVVDFGMGQMTTRFLAEAIGQHSLNTAKGIVRLVLIVRGIAALPTTVLIIALSSYLAKLFNIPTNSTYFIFAAVAFLPYLIFSAFSGILIGFQKYEYQTYLVLSTSLPRAIIAIILVVLGFGVQEILVAYTAIWILGSFFGLFLLSRLIPIREPFSPSLLEPATRKSALMFSLAAMGILVVDYFLWQNAEVMFLGIYRSVEEVGFYNIAYKIPAMAITLIPFVFSQVLLPAVSEQFGKGDIENIRKIYSTASRYLMMLTFPIAAIGIALAKPIITVVFGPSYTSSIVLMQIVFFPFAMRGLTNAFGSIIYGIKEPAYLLKVGSVLVCLSIGLNLWLIPKYGTIGAAVAISVPRVISLPIYIFFVSRKISTPWPLGDTLKIALSSLIMGLAVYGLQSHLSMALSLVAGIPLGVIVYIIAILIFKIIKDQDVAILKGVRDYLSTVFRKRYDLLIRFMEKIVVRQKIKP